MCWAVVGQAVLIILIAVAGFTVVTSLWSRARAISDMSPIVHLPEELLEDTRLLVEESGVASSDYSAVVRFVSNPLGWAKLRTINGVEPYIRRLCRCWVARSLILALVPANVYVAWTNSWWWLLGILPLYVVHQWVDAVQCDTNKILFVYSNAYDRLFSDEEWESSEAAAEARGKMEEFAQEEEPS